MDPKNIRLILAYDGTRYHGWQRQKNAHTIQEILEDRLRMMTGGPVTLLASGRTDAGVHALNQVCNFTTLSALPPESIRKGLNSLLPVDILVKEAQYVPASFHSRYSAKSKIYEYRILNRALPDIFQRDFQWHIRHPLDTESMAASISVLRGTRDFSSFCSAGSGTTNPVRTVLSAEITGPEQGLLRITIEADGFLRHMVRNIVGTAVEAGLGKISPERFQEIVRLRDRRRAGVKAPARGLFLVSVKY
ncbi:MAG: tRNA pseudouridine(38-40) synthase TruA [Deltaproteobacteria bacterium]|nr:tRNA pseudouridine(38-40) synthase TruA [Deltaproteobacteria bacterium]MBW2048895.1 tRNA pseudouridine(38-40) synthase TruA [Deltaproteobacteria bacterium]MBW2111452.1 tRNA pseudouridine(38-40) synthase TruA [Deltaproteobacteria bacterium]MBW2354431.1 tRNA pseudouridine(38-40) synthase TruA [Deltaproteobacteria bacterium]HDZ89221.1 tRNA pseudouridine(38-40) synthase TruA [Deltaproteobacteria bacterium]